MTLGKEGDMDRWKLEYEIKKRGITIEKFCNDLKISKSAYYRKCKGISEFTQSEIERIINYLGLDSPMGIFFAEKCPIGHDKETA